MKKARTSSRIARGALLALALAAALAGCPDRTELADQVGGKAGREVQDVKTRLNKAQGVEQQRAEGAARATE